MKGLKDKVAIVTGGGSGLGRADCIELAREGCKVVIADCDPTGAKQTAAHVTQAGGEALVVGVDVADSDSVQTMVQQVLERYARIDILVNNAGVVGEMARVHEVSEASWDQVMNVDLKGTFLCSKYVLPTMLEQHGGTIINIASVSGFIASNTAAAYTAAKHGVVGFTKQLAYDYGHAGIRAVGIAPGVIETPLTKDWTCAGGPFHELTMQAPAGRYGRPGDVARLLCFLASEDADYMQGHTFPIDGGSIIR